MLTENSFSLKNPNVVTFITPILKTKMLSKLDEQVPWNYVSAPEGQTKAQVIANIKYFIEHKLDAFILASLNVIPYFTQADYLSIGTEAPTDNAQKFLALFVYLEANGFPGVAEFNKAINFWSGEQGKLKALNCSNEISDNNIPSIAAMYDVCSIMQKYLYCDDNLLSCAVSRVYAAHASHSVNIYISSPKISEEPGLTVANYFWSVELSTLMTLKWRGLVKEININLYDDHKQQWQKGFSLFSAKGDAVPIRRRFKHPGDAEEIADRFIPHCHMTPAEELIFKYSKARPDITYGQLKKIAYEWRERTRLHKRQREEQQEEGQQQQSNTNNTTKSKRI